MYGRYWLMRHDAVALVAHGSLCWMLHGSRSRVSGLHPMAPNLNRNNHHLLRNHVNQSSNQKKEIIMTVNQYA